MNYEKLGAFYLGAETGAEPLEAPLLYDARDLTTHAVCIGMTGSGKTGLCLDLLEEAAMDRVPALIIDPKGDMTNLLLTFPELRGSDFAPWIDPDDARRREQTIEEFADAQAGLWKKGLAKWGQSGERIRTLRETCDLAVYTPGSDAGIPISVMSSFTAPTADWDEDAEYLRERIAGTVSGILGLIGVDVDPVQSREHILLSNIFEHFWRAGEDLDLAKLILSIQDPPVRRLGVFDVDTFFPEKDRLALAMQLNNLIAAPGFQSWVHGQPLDIPGFMTGADGRPRHSIFYIAHLSEAERMFFVTLLLNQVITWMRQQAGTTSLRALLYMDEVFGFLPPVAEPPSKRPFLTLFKQARAYGLGVVLSTQNPVDLDYKALTNAGTWFIGRLQTERDRGRLLDGLEVAASSGGASRSELEALIASLEKREFLLHNVHEGAPLRFRTRWAMSYLRGPLTRDQVADLMDGRGADAPAAVDEVTGSTTDAVRPELAAAEDGFAATPPSVGGDVSQLFVPVSLGATGAALSVEEEIGAGASVADQSLVYRPCVLARGAVTYFHRASGAQDRHEFALAGSPDHLGAVRWDDATALGASVRPIAAPEDGARFAPLPDGLNSARELAGARKDLEDFLYRTRRITLFEAPALDRYSEPGQSAADFRLALATEARERRDEEIDALEERYETKLDRLDERIRRARGQLARHEADASAKKRETIVAIGESVLGAFLGRRSSRSASAGLRRVRMSSAAAQRAEEAEENLETLEEDARELEAELAEKVLDVTGRWEGAALELEEVVVTPRRSDVDVEDVAIGWLPYRRVSCELDGERMLHDVPAW
ncbi:MAG: type IV secretion system DNA-binding domain-containing protein [Gemmatimonadota bacterium]|nr:type IV secretion system DNA-binding domain-containing protein [Gemmatimonadota bacterium]